MKDILKGKLVQLAAVDPEEVSKSFAAWNRDSEYKRLLDTEPSLIMIAGHDGEQMAELTKTGVVKMGFK